MISIRLTSVLISLILASPIVYGQTITSRTCSLNSDAIRSFGGLRLGSGLQLLKTRYPSAESRGRWTNNSSTSAFIVRDPSPKIAALGLIFSPQNLLVAFSVHYQPQYGITINDQTKNVLEVLGLNIPSHKWEVTERTDQESVAIRCNDFAIYSQLKRSDDRAKQNEFVFMVFDHSLLRELNKASDNGSGRIPAIDDQLRSNGRHTFPRISSEFLIEFPGEPKTRIVTGLYGEIEEATYITKDSVLRCEYGRMSQELKSIYKIATDEQLRLIAIEASKLFGYVSPTVSVSNSRFGRSFRIRGYKYIEGESAIIEHHVFIGKEYSITLIVAARSESYPTAAITRFLSSLRLGSSDWN